MDKKAFDKMYDDVCRNGTAHILCDVVGDGMETLEISGAAPLIFAGICTIVKSAVMADVTKLGANPEDYLDALHQIVLREIEYEMSPPAATGQAQKTK